MARSRDVILLAALITGAMGVTTLDGLGVQGALAHTLEEHVLVDSLVPRAKLLAGLMTTLA